MDFPKQASQVTSPSRQAAKEVRRNSPTRQARTCYDHLAGVAGVTLMDTMMQRDWLEVSKEAKGRTHFHLTPAGQQALTDRGVDLLPARNTRRMYAYGCVDWTERRFHLGGALGASILDALRTAGVVQQQSGTRVATMLKPLTCWLDSTLD
jgi:hypothetical protein